MILCCEAERKENDFLNPFLVKAMAVNINKLSMHVEKRANVNRMIQSETTRRANDLSYDAYKSTTCK